MAANLNLHLDQYSSYKLDVTIHEDDTTPKDLTDFDGLFKIADIDSNEKLLEIRGNIAGSKDKVTVTDAKNGKLTVFIDKVTLPAMQVTDVDKDKYDYFFTLSLVNKNTNTILRFLDGLASVSKGIS